MPERPLAGLDLSYLDEEVRASVNEALKATGILVRRVTKILIKLEERHANEDLPLKHWIVQVRGGLASAAGGRQISDHELHEMNTIVAVIDLLASVDEARAYRSDNPRPSYLRVVR